MSQETKLEAKTGYSKNGLPYVCIGNSPHTLVVFEGLGFENKPPSGLQLRFTAGDYKRFTKEYTIYSVGRKPDLPDSYSTRDMPNDYANMIKEELEPPVDILGLSTGGTIAQYFALDHPQLVRRLVLAAQAIHSTKTEKNCRCTQRIWHVKANGDQHTLPCLTVCIQKVE